MMDKLWLVLFVALAGFYLGYGLPVRSSPETYPHSSRESESGWSFEAGWHPAIPALALVITSIGLLVGCTWCFRHKDCKLFSTSATNFVNQQRQPVANFVEASNNNITEDNNNGPISLREMQNIANNNATAYIVSENEERNRVNRDSVVEFVPLPSGIGAVDPLERCADWFAGESFPRSRLQYLREIGRGWFGRVVEGEIEDEGGTSSVAVKILNQNASLEDKARFLDEAKMIRDVTHENILPFIAKCLDEDPWILMLELCPMDLQQYLISNRPKMAIMNESGVPLRLMGDVATALAYLHARGYLYRNVTTTNVLVRGQGTNARAVLGAYVFTEPPYELQAPECRRRPPVYTTSSEIWATGNLIWEVCAWGSAPLHHPPRLPDLPCPYRNHLYQIMQLCWHANPENRPTAAQVQDLINHLYTTHIHSSDSGLDNDDFEDRWQRLKPNTIPKVDEHIAIVHAPSISNTSNFTISEQELDIPTTTQDTLSLDLDTAVSRSSSILSDKDPMSSQIKSESLTNLHGSLEDVRNIYLTHNETAVLECHQGNISLEDREREQDKSDSSMDPWLKEIIAGSQDDVSYYRDVSDVIKNLDNILNSEKTSSSESSHQASPSRDNLSLDCKKEYTMQSSLVKSPGISNFQNILDGGFDSKDETCEEEEGDDTIGTLSHSFERHSDTTSQHTLANLTPETPNKDFDILNKIENATSTVTDLKTDIINNIECVLPNEKDETVKSELPNLKELCQISLNSVSVLNSEKNTNKDCDNTIQENGMTDKKENQSKSVEDRAPVEQLLSEVSLVENQIENHEVSNLEHCCSSVMPNEMHKSETNTISPVIHHRTINDMSSELLIKSERNMESSDFCIPDKIRVSTEDQSKAIQSETQMLQKDVHSDERPSNVELGSVNNSLEEHLFTLQTGRGLEEEQIGPICESVNTPDDDKQKFTDEEDTKESERRINLLLDSKELILEPLEETVKTKEINQINGEFANINNEVDQKEFSLELKSSEDAIISSTTQKIDEIFREKLTNSINLDKEKLSVQLKSVPIEKDVIYITTMQINDNIQSPTMTELDYNELSVESNLGEVSENIASCPVTQKIENVQETTSTELVNNQILVAQVQEENINESTSKKSIENVQHNSEELMKPLESVKSNIEKSDKIETDAILISKVIETSPVIVQNIVEKDIGIDKDEQVKFNSSNESRSDSNKDDNLLKQSYNSTVYMDLINNTSSEILHVYNIDKEVVMPSLDSTILQGSFVLDDSTVYLDLPTRIKETTEFLNTERKMSVQNDNIEIENALSSSTPEGNSVKDNSANNHELIDDSRVLKFEQKYAESSPPESPTQSHHTDTFDENSSVVLGPFENNSIGSYHQHRPQGDLVDLPKEELLAFSSNFSEMNLETPSPLRDVNFLKEVPDIVPDDLLFDDLETISEVKRDISESLPLPESNSSQDETDSQGAKDKVAAPLTPPNSPGVFLASVPQPKYLVDIDLNPPSPPEVRDVNLLLQNEIELNQIELQITSKLAMAENENNMNIEYSGPLVEEGLEQDSLLMEDDAAPAERYLAGNLTLDEECVQALRNELELKLPLAQVASIEPQPELPPPPELIVNYPGALSPIAEETRQQLSAYENDAQWNPVTLPDSSESYPEPCNNSTDEVTDLSVGNSGINENTFLVHSESEHNTYTVDKDQSSKKFTMSTDSLNGSPMKVKVTESQSPIDEKTYTKKEDDVTNCERISQVSPCLLSPSTDTTIPENSENATASPTFIKTFVPSDSKFNNTQCLSIATSIDSCCSNDTLYNVEENFDDLVMDPDIPIDFDKDEEFRERRHSYCSTYTIKDDKSDACETFSPDSITENNYTYTNIARTDIPTITPSADTKSDKSDKKSNDLAYGTLPSYSNCATEYLSGMEDAWKLPQPELIRKSPIQDTIHSSPPQFTTLPDTSRDNLEIKFEPSIKKMDSVEITCLKDNTSFHTSTPFGDGFKNIDESTIESVSEVCFAVSSIRNDNSLLQSTDEKVQDMSPIADIAFLNSTLLDEKKTTLKSDSSTEPQNNSNNSVESRVNSTLTYSDFEKSVSNMPQQNSKDNNSVESKVNSTITYSDFEKSATNKPQNNSKDNNSAESRVNSTLTYSDFEKSATNKPQHSSMENNSVESRVSSEDFLKSIQERPQDLSSGINASYLMLANERNFSLSVSGGDSIPPSQSDSLGTESTLPLVSLPPIHSNFNELKQIEQADILVTDLDAEEETDQPHSIIITDPKKNVDETLCKTFDSHTNENLLDTFNSHDYSKRLSNDFEEFVGETFVNVTSDVRNQASNHESPEKIDDLPKNLVPNGAVKQEVVLHDESNYNGTTQVYATVNFLNDAFEELLESSVDGNESKSIENTHNQQILEEKSTTIKENVVISANDCLADKENLVPNEINGLPTSSKPAEHQAITNGVPEKVVTESFLQNEKNFCQSDRYLPLLSDIRFTGPASEIMSTSFNQDSPTEPESPGSEKDKKCDEAADIIKEWDSDSDNQSSNSSSGEFIWKDGDGRETAVVPSTQFQHERDGTSTSAGDQNIHGGEAPASSASGDSGSGSEGDEEFVPSSWDCSAAPSKSSLRSLEQVAPSKKRVVFKRQKYHCVYEYPREISEVESDSPAAYMPDLSTYCEWDPATAEDAELGYSQLFGAPNPLDMFTLRSGIAYGADYDEDFFISSSARPFESLGIMSTSSQFFPGKHVKPALVERDINDVTDHFRPTLSPLTTMVQTRTPSLDFTTPDSGVEDITPGSMTSEDDYKKKLAEDISSWRPADSGSSSESVSPSSPASETLGGLRHTRDKLKLDLPPSPHIPSPRHNRVFNFVLDKPKRHRYSDETQRPPEIGTTPLVMTDETPIITNISATLPIKKEAEDVEVPEPTFSTFGKCIEKNTEAEQKCIVLDEVQNTEPETVTKEEDESQVKVETVKGEGTVLDSGDEDSGIESSKATLERNKTPNVS